MLLIFMGPSCTGKSTIADIIKKEKNVQVYTGKDYLRFAKNEDEAWNVFYQQLRESSNSNELSSESIIYIISEERLIEKLKSLNNAIFIKFTADLDTVKERFSKRMNGVLPKPVEKMLERQVMEWEEIGFDLSLDTSNADSTELVNKIIELC